MIQELIVDAITTGTTKARWDVDRLNHINRLSLSEINDEALCSLTLNVDEGIL